ncbi:DNA polymerase I [Agathobacter sp.]|nr:DNA polymerase I [Agathobacter sp.]
MSEKLVLIDGHSILNRAYHGLPDLTNSEGLHTNAVYGFLNIMFKILDEEKPDYLTVAFDVHAPTFRHRMFDAYKGTRKPMDEELRQQVPMIKEMLTAMGIKIVEKEGYEADDILGTLSVRAEKAGMDVAIISGDRDLLQLATDHVMVRIPKTKKTGTEIENYNTADVIEKYGVTPKEFIDVKALQGDTSDNIPGVPGIGEKTAGALIAKYHCIEAVHEDAENVKPPRASKNIVEYWEQALMSKELATIILDAPVDYEFSDAKLSGGVESLYTEEAFLLCKRYEFKNMLSRFNVEAPKNNAEEHFVVVRDLKTAESGMDVAIISGDRDLLQLATDHVMVRIPKTKKTGTEIENYNTADVIEKYGVTPKEFIDVKALQGDTSDNIPGVPGIGEKTAGALIAKYHCIEAVHEDAENVKPPRASKNIVEYWEQALMSKELATIILDAPVDYEFSDAKLSGGVESLYTEEAFLLCKRYEFKNMLSRFNVEAPKNNAEEHFVVVRDLKTAESVFEKAKGREVAFAVVPGESLENSESDGQLSLFSEPVSNDYLAVSICFSEEDIYFICTGDEISSSFLDEKLNNLEVKSWISPDLKTNLHRFKSKEIKADDRGRYFDMMVAAYLINPLVGEYPYDAVAKDYLGLMLSSKKDYLGKLDFTRMMKEDEKKAVDCACYEVYTAWKSKPVLLQKLKEMDMLTLYKDIELPLVFVLYDMENEGIRADGIKLKEYGDKLAVSITELEKKIYEAAGEEFNINSPKQLGVILFEKLGLPNEKKTKTGYSTAADVLEKLAPEYPIVADILEYRQLTKLKSTYADGLSGYIASDGKIHTTLNQTITATGRLSSTEPNLQNIPIRIELGKLIRKVFLPEDGDLFVDSDYSQIELRVLAALSGDERMIEAFKNGQDIHRSTASLVFDTPFDEVTDLQRRNAKAVNFGIVYGISAFGLSNDLGISRKEAQGYIDSYFVKYPKIKEFLDQTVLDAKKNGYTKTMFGRIRPIPELNSSNFMQRQFGERVAMNSPIQGTAADIIKIAMIRVHDRLLDEGLKSRLILQVHDELLIETKEAEKDKVIKLLEKEMRGAVNMKVSMEVGTECGYDWYDAH